MYFLTLLIVSLQIWSPIICPPASNKACGMAAKKPETDIQNEVHWNHGYFRRILLKGPTLEPKSLPNKNKTHIARQESSSKEKIEVSEESSEKKKTTAEYWNATHERCDYERIRCLRAYATGAVCARTLYYQYYSFPNYCTLEFHNCMARYEDIWMLAYMGICTELDIEKELYVDMGYDQMTNNTFLKQMYVADSGDITNVG